MLFEIVHAHELCLGIYYEQSKEPPPEGPPKLHLLIESNEEFRVRSVSSSRYLRLISTFRSPGRTSSS